MTTAGPFGTPESTTAEILGQYARDLKAQGFAEDLIHSLVRQASMTLHRDGILVSPIEQRDPRMDALLAPDAEPHFCEGIVAALKAHRQLLEVVAEVTKR